MPNIHSFAATYSEARDKFLSAARIAGAATYRYDNPTKGPAGEALSTDVARIGPDDASKVVMTISSTHGVEGYCGSGFQVDWLASVGAAGACRKDTAALMVHAINPYGFAWTRRVTEEGNDLNRNYVDHAQALSGERRLSRDRRPSDSRGLQRRRDRGRRCQARAPIARRSATLPISGRVGRPVQPSRRHVLRRRRRRAGPIARCMPSPTSSCKGRSDVAVIDFHTGLGPYGYGEPITHYDIDTPRFTPRARFLGQIGHRIQARPDRVAGARRARPLRPARVLPEPATRLTMCTLEYGTFDRESGQKAFRADHWLHKYGDPLGKEAGPIRAAMRRQFYPDTDDWKEAVLFRGHQIVRQADRRRAARARSDQNALGDKHRKLAVFPPDAPHPAKKPPCVHWWR